MMDKGPLMWVLAIDNHSSTHGKPWNHSLHASPRRSLGLLLRRAWVRSIMKAAASRTITTCVKQVRA